MKLVGTLRGIIRRLWLLRNIRKYTWVFIHREAIPFGPPWYEWILVKIFKKKIVYDFDDSLWIKQVSNANLWACVIKPTTKISNICSISMKVCAGNPYLAAYAKQYNNRVCVIPTTIDTENTHTLIKQHQADREVVVGWTGSHSTLPYLSLVAEAIGSLEKSYPIKFLVICNEIPKLNLNSLVYKQWNKETEIQDLLKIDIGIMPLTETEWAEGKCGLKALQYMALGIPALVSSVGVNKQIVEHEIDGYFCNSKEEWIMYIERLIKKPELRGCMGKKGREKVVNNYSVESNSQAFISLFEDAIAI